MKKYFLLVVIFILITVAGNAGSDKGYYVNDSKSDLYAQLKLANLGLSNEAYELALKGYSKLEKEGKLQNSSLITIIDFSQSSTKKRMYVIDLQKKALLYNTYVAHGRNTGEEYAKYFSNEEGTHKSSIGFYITENTAKGATVGLSLIIEGVEKGFNDKAMQRAIIMHGADYATESFIQKNGRLGRSYGCPALPPEWIKPVSETIKGGTCMFIYYPDNSYIRNSSLLN